MSVIRLSDSRIMIHDPCDIDESIKNEIDKLGDVAFIIAPGSYHHLYISSAQESFPNAETFICPGI